MELISIRRKSFEGRAIRITEENIADVAEWVGSYPMVDRSKGAERLCVRIFEGSMMGHPKYTKAYVGDWVTEAEGRFQRHQDRVFRLRYEEIPEGGTCSTAA